MIQLDAATTALVLIDLQHGIVGMTLAPRTGPEIAETGKALAAQFRAANATVVPVNVAWRDDYADAPKSLVDRPMVRPAGGLGQHWGTLVDGLEQPGDLRITKRQWGAFFGTELDLQLRRRGIRAIVLGGIATNFGVESTARQAWELGYDVVVLKDACTAVSAELHAMAFEHIFPRIARVATISDLTFDAS